MLFAVARHRQPLGVARVERQRSGQRPALPEADVVGAARRGDRVAPPPRLAIPVPGLEGRRYGAYAGLCLEAQNFPDAVNQPGFPDPIFTPDRPYSQRLEIEIART